MGKFCYFAANNSKNMKKIGVDTLKQAS